jgi:Arm domain-containing DNA-binding protein
MALTHTAILKASATDTACKLSDGDGLHLLVKPGGSKLWRFRYRYMGKENMLALGPFPEVSLGAARTKRDDAKKLLWPPGPTRPLSASSTKWLQQSLPPIPSAPSPLSILTA